MPVNCSGKKPGRIQPFGGREQGGGENGKESSSRHIFVLATSSSTGKQVFVQTSKTRRN